MFNHNDRLIELLNLDNRSELTTEQYNELIRLLDETKERIFLINSGQ